MGNKRIGVICGGSGSSKFVTALANYFRGSKINGKSLSGFVPNVADNFWYHALYVCPDIDIITYALSEKLDTSKGWGVAFDTFNFLKALGEASGREEWFQLGDKDLATSVLRTELINQGRTLSQITNFFRKRLGISYPIAPATDDRVQTYIKTAAGMMHLQEFWVRDKGRPAVIDVEYSGIEKAHANKQAVKLCRDFVVICPANPVTSILPTVKLKEFGGALKKAKVLAISPFLGERAFSGPAAKLMRAIRMESSSFGVAKLYSSFLNILLVEQKEDPKIIRKIEDIGIECIRTQITIGSEKEKQIVAKEIVNAI